MATILLGLSIKATVTNHAPTVIPTITATTIIEREVLEATIA